MRAKARGKKARPGRKKATSAPPASRTPKRGKHGARQAAGRRPELLDRLTGSTGFAASNAVPAAGSVPASYELGEAVEGNYRNGGM